MDDVWASAVQIFPILDHALTDSESTQEDVDSLINELNKMDLTETVYDMIFVEISAVLKKQTVHNFWEFFHEKCSYPKNGLVRFQTAVKYLYNEFLIYQNILKRLELYKQNSTFQNKHYKKRNDLEEFNVLLRAALLSQLPLNFTDIIYQFYKILFKVLVNYKSEQEKQLELLTENIEGTLKCDGCDCVREDCQCFNLMVIFIKTNRYLSEMNLLNRLAGQSLMDLIQERIKSHVNETCQGSSDVSHLGRLEIWLQKNVFIWLPKIYDNSSSDEITDHENLEDLENLNSLKAKYTYHLYETYAHTIINQFFNIIIEYPDSKPSIDDLKICLTKIDLRNYLANTVKQSLETRLLHPGVDTSDILTGYVAAIKALRHLDSSGVLLEVITEPVKEYLRMRNDTVRCVITALTEEGPTDLAEELAKSETLKEDAVSANDDMANWETWMPDPIDANPKKSSKTNRSADIISMVVDIYGSKELFVNEYRNLLAERLLSNLDFNVEKEIRNLELLKLRFGDGLLHSCEVMLKDISDSKRINAHIHCDAEYNDGKAFEMSTLIVSAQFWPAFKKEIVELPDSIKKQFDKFSKSYEAHKGNRTLHWNTMNGKVNIEVEFADKKLDLTVTTIQATIIMHFQNQSEWELDKLSHEMKIPASILRKRISFWQTQGLIKETKEDIFTLADESIQETMEEMQSHHPHEICEDDETESAMASASDQREEELQVFWSYIVGMLTNLDSLPLERIHQMLKMFANVCVVEFSQQELKNFLQRKVKEQQLLFAAGVYYLPK